MDRNSKVIHRTRVIIITLVMERNSDFIDIYSFIVLWVNNPLLFTLYFILLCNHNNKNY